MVDGCSRVCQGARPCGPGGLLTGADGKNEALGIEGRSIIEMDSYAVALEFCGHRACADVLVGDPRARDHLIRVGLEERQRGAVVGGGKWRGATRCGGEIAAVAEKLKRLDPEMVDGRRAEVSHARGRGAPSPGVEQPGRRVDDGEIRGRFASPSTRRAARWVPWIPPPMISQRYIQHLPGEKWPVSRGRHVSARPVEDESVSATHVQLQLNRNKKKQQASLRLRPMVGAAASQLHPVCRVV